MKYEAKEIWSLKVKIWEWKRREKLDPPLEYWLIGQNLKRKTAFVIKVQSKIF